MKKVVNIKFNQGIDSMVKVLNYLRRKEIEVDEVSMKREDKENIIVNISFGEGVSEEKILSNLKKLYDVESIEIA